jgi:hypothetical protein
MRGDLMTRIPLALEPQHLDYIVAVLRRCAWQEANPILVDITQQVSPQQQAAVAQVTHPTDAPLEALP